MLVIKLFNDLKPLSIQKVAVVLHYENTTNTQRNDTDTDVCVYTRRARAHVHEYEAREA